MNRKWKKSAKDRVVAGPDGRPRGDVVIDAEEFEAASRDPAVRKQLAAAKAYRAKLDREGRNR